MSLKDYRFDGEEKLELRGMNTGAKKDGVDKEDILRRTEKNLGRIEALQDKLYADGRESVLIILQAMDAAGKDSTVKHVMGCVNPQGIDVHSFKQPTSEELSHDYLWRAMKALPARGKMALFNRSYYEDVLVVKVHALQKNYKMPARVLEDPDFFKKRYRQIRHFEEYLYENGCRVVKIPEPFQRKTERAFSGAHPGGGEELEIFPGGYPGTGLLERLYGRLRGGRKRDGYPPQSMVCDPG